MSENARGTSYTEITARQQETWASGDFHQIARQNVCMAEALCDAVDLRAGERVLDVACGSGTAALVAARRYCDVTGIDYVPALLDRARERAAADQLDAEFRAEDAQNLSCSDSSFDTILSVYGVQFAPDQDRAAEELLRACRVGGKIGLASPLPEGWSGDFFKAMAQYSPPPSGTKPATRWSTDVGLNDLLGAGTRWIRSEKRTAVQYYLSVDHAAEVFLTYFGPAVKASEGGASEDLRSDLKAVFGRYNRATDGTAMIENTYMLTVAERG
jgi:SAM-dependent methyltransferase